MATTDSMDKVAQAEQITAKETIRLTITSEAGLRLRVAAAKRDISVGEMVSELAQTNLPAVPIEGGKSRARV